MTVSLLNSLLSCESVCLHIITLLIFCFCLLFFFFFRNFWQVVREFSDSQRKKLLAFITGSDRIPLGGLSKLKLIIVKNGSDSDR